MISRYKIQTIILGLVTTWVVSSSCNKDLDQFPYTPSPALSTSRALGDSLLTRVKDTLFYRLVERGGLLSTINNKAAKFTVFAPDSSAMKVLVNGLSLGAISATAPSSVVSNFIRNTLTVADAAGIAGYHIIPLEYPTSAFSSNFPNVQIATIFNPLPTVNPFLRLTVFPSNRNGLFVNNAPIIGPDIKTANGYIHEMAAPLVPPRRALWERIDKDTSISIFRAAVIRADSGTVTPPPTATPTNLQSALNSFGANLTVFAPTNVAMKATLSALTGLSTTLPDSIFRNFVASSPLISTLLVKGIVTYHILGVRAFLNNFPTTAFNYPTFLNQGIPTHPGVTLQATFTGPFVSAATVKGVANATPASILINPTPDTQATGSLVAAYTGTSDQLYTNGILHKINQVLLFQ